VNSIFTIAKCFIFSKLVMFPKYIFIYLLFMYSSHFTYNYLEAYIQCIYINYLTGTYYIIVFNSFYVCVDKLFVIVMFLGWLNAFSWMDSILF